MKQVKYKKQTTNPTFRVSVLLHNIRSTHNVGSIFRTADAAGVTRIYLSGYTPGPLDRFGRARKDIAKVSLGAEKSIDWEHIDNPKELIQKMKKENPAVQVIALEQSERSVDYTTVRIPDGCQEILFILGNEVEGISKDILSLASVVAEIPMRGEKESLNVSVAFGIALFRILGI